MEARGWTRYCRNRSVFGGAGAAQRAPAHGELRRGGRLPPCRAESLWPVRQVRGAAGRPNLRLGLAPSAMPRFPLTATGGAGGPRASPSAAALGVAGTLAN